MIQYMKDAPKVYLCGYTSTIGCQNCGFEEPNATRNNSLEDTLLIESQSRQARVDLQQTAISQGSQFVIQKGLEMCVRHFLSINWDL